ncbi:uncharacterized protein FA14DRAFT_171175 [Meira miltonrushii]|uniref:Uncharacterized protein n=1 Tax=Meira miltonrushii TaxID=1280837 RepID=A0A316VLI4_9BASI|nr:uncharacterized protein FA14DRAFT_171175 [Meira miltonrushii]PWN38489.1 hypothetical protein FA14DRAFT_171175 [Meira miltonrushii]
MMAISSQQMTPALSQIPGSSTSPPPLIDSLKELQSSHQASYIVLSNRAGASSSSPGLRYDSANLIVQARGSLEEDGGFDGLRQILYTHQDLQFIFLKFCSKVILVQLVPEHTSAVQRARLMVFGRSLAAQMPSSNSRDHGDSKVNVITINDAIQLTDPFLRAQLAVGSSSGPSSFIPRSFTQSSISSMQAGSSIGSPSAHGHTPDVPISVSSTTLHSSPFPQSHSLSTIDTSSSTSHATHLSFTGLPAVGLGIGGFGGGAISPFRETFEGGNDAYGGMMLDGEDDKKRESNSTIMQFTRLNKPISLRSGSSPIKEPGGALMRRESTIGADSESGLEDSLHPQFPDPPKRNSQLSRLGVPEQGQGQLSPSMSTTTGLIDSYQQRYSFEQRPQMRESGSGSLLNSIGDLDLSIETGNLSRNAIHTRSIRHAPSLPSIFNSVSDGSSAVNSNSGGGGLFGRINNGTGVEVVPSFLQNNKQSISHRSRQNRAASFSASSVMTHESVFAELRNARDLVFVDQNDLYSFEQLERERLDFLRWKEDQERMILAKEKQRERQRRLMDEAKREKVMKKLQIEQGLSDQIVTPTMDDEKDTKIRETDVKQPTKVIRPTKSKSTISTNSQSDEYKNESKSGASTKARSKRSFTTGTRSTQSPLHPPPLLPLPKSPSEPLSKIQKKKTSETSSDDIAAIFARHSKAQSDEVKDGVESLKKSIQDLRNMTSGTDNDSSVRSSRDRISRQQTSPPLAGNVKAAIEREMRRPVITLEGHVRPRVRQMRAHSYGEQGQPAVNALQPSLSADGRSNDVTKSPLIKSMMEAQQKAQLSGQSSHSHRDSDYSDAFTDKAADMGVSSTTPLSPAVIKVVDPDGKQVGSGWALSEVKGMQVGSPVDKELPVLPPSSKRRSSGSPTPSLLHLSEMVGFAIDYTEEEKKSLSEKFSSRRGTLSDASDVDVAATHDAEQQRAPIASGLSRASSVERFDELVEMIESSRALDHGSDNRHRANFSTVTSNSLPSVSSSRNYETADTALTKTSSTTLIDQIFRSKFNEPPQRKEVIELKESDGMTNDQLNAILARQNQLDNLLSDLQRKRTITKEVEAAARARWARQQVERQKLGAYERSLLESEERSRRARTDNMSLQEEEKQRQLEDEHAEVEKRIMEEEERRKILVRQKEIRNEKLRMAKEMQLKLHQEIKGLQQSRQQRRLQIQQEMKQKMHSKDCLLNGSLTIQFGSGQRFRRALFELYNDRLSLYDESKDEQSKKLIETIKVMKGSIVKLSEAFEEVQVPHAFSIHLSTDTQFGLLSSMKEPIIAYTDDESSKEQLMAGLSVLSGLDSNIFLITVRCTSEHGSGKQSSPSPQGSEPSQVKQRIPDLNLPAENNSYYSKDQRAIRMGKRIFKLEKEKFANLDEAILKAREKITESRRRYSQDARTRKKSLGIKTKDYHEIGYHKANSRFRRQVDAILKDETNPIKDRGEAKQFAKQFMKPGETFDLFIRVFCVCMQTLKSEFNKVSLNFKYIQHLLMLLMIFIAVVILFYHTSLAVRLKLDGTSQDGVVPEHSYQIPTRQRTPNIHRPSSKYSAQQIPTRRRTPNLTRPSSKNNAPSEMKVELPEQDQTSKQQSESRKRYPSGYFSQEQHAIRLAKSRQFLNATGHTNFDDALAAAKEKLKEKKSRENRKRRQNQKELGIKPKNYHTFYTRTKEVECESVFTQTVGCLFFRGSNVAFQGSHSEEQRTPMESNTPSHKNPLPDLNLPGQKSDYLSNSIDSKARRMGAKLFKKGDLTTLDQAISSSMILLTERKKQDNLKYREKKKMLGIKRKNCRKPGYNLQISRINRKAKRILEEENGITDPAIATQMAEAIFKERGKRYYENRAMKKKIKREETLKASEPK